MSLQINRVTCLIKVQSNIQLSNIFFLETFILLSFLLIELADDRTLMIQQGDFLA